MQPTLTEETQAHELPEPKKCLSSGSEEILPGFPNALCAECREKFIRFPFPAWIKAFGVGVGLVVVFSLFSFFGNLQTGIHMERGVRAEKDHRYFTAQKEFEQVLEKVPAHVEASAHLLISAYYNQDIPALAKAATSLEGKSFENQELYEQANHIMTLGGQFFPSDSLNALMEKVKDTAMEVRAMAIEDYYRKNPTDVSAGLKLASDAFNGEDYAKADTLLQKIMADDPENISAITLMASVRRYQKDPSGALIYIERLLDLNKEHLYGLSSKARVMIMMKKDDEALKLAKKVDQLDKTFAYNRATLAIVYHYSNKIKERDEIVNKAKAGKDSLVMQFMQYAIDILQKIRNYAQDAPVQKVRELMQD